jgi:hypothetical protein
MSQPNNTSLAKLLATENLTVQQSNVSTASFDVKNRVLTLPIWATEDKFVEDHMTGHEVGHALYTPLDGWHDAVCSKGASFKSYLNVVEDARIEKLIQRKYPGLRGSFIKSYRKLLADGFFGADLATINQMGLIDRINTYFKCGTSSGVRFEADEKVWLDRIANAETWKQVVQITEDLFAFAKEKAEQEQAEQSQEFSEDDTDDQQDFGEDGDSSDFEDGDDWEESDDESSADGGTASDDFDALFDDQDGEDSSTSTKSAGKSIEDSIASETDENLRNAMENELTDALDGNTEVVNLRIRKTNTDSQVISNKELLSAFSDPVVTGHRYNQTPETRAFGRVLAETMSRNWYRQNKKSIQIMVKEFEMKKSAAEFARASLARTGTLDTVKMNNYKITEDIFRKVTVIPEGKNHGFIMMLDMSGSMVDEFYHVAQHTVLMASFCRAINVPFRVYGFADYMSWKDDNRPTPQTGDVVAPYDAHLIELFNEKMTKSQFAQCAGELLLFGWGLRNRYSSFAPKADDLLSQEDIYAAKELTNYALNSYSAREAAAPIFGLGGTPLDAGIVTLIPQAIKFREQNRLDKLHTIFLTDGASHPTYYIKENEYGHQSERRLDDFNRYTYGNKKRVTIVCDYNNQQYRIRSDDHQDDTTMFLKMYKDVTGSENQGYFVVGGSSGHLMSVVCRFTKVRSLDETIAKNMRSKFNRGEHVEVSVSGYDTMYLLSAKKLGKQETALSEVDSGATKTQLRNAFKKSSKSGAANRAMLLSIARAVA